MPTVLCSAAPQIPVSQQSSLYAGRLYSRRRLDLRARLLARREEGRGFIVVHGRTIDLSRSGAGLTVSCELASGTEVVLCLRLPGSGHPLCLRAVVTRRRGFRVGLAFVQPSAQQRLLLCELCYA
jgi:PilZ domain